MAKKSDEKPVETQPTGTKPGETPPRVTADASGLSEEEIAKLRDPTAEPALIEVEAFDFEALEARIKAHMDARIDEALEARIKAHMDARIDEVLDAIAARDVLDAIEARPTRTELERMITGKAQPATKFDRGSIPELIEVRTRGNRKRHHRAAIAFGPEWKTLITAELTDGQLEAIANDELLEKRQVD